MNRRQINKIIAQLGPIFDFPIKVLLQSSKNEKKIVQGPRDFVQNLKISPKPED